jgi:predicted membrane protein
MGIPQLLASLADLGGLSRRQLLFFVGVSVVLVAFLASREARKAFWDPTRSTGGSPAAMRTHRLLMVYALCAAILGGSLISWVRDKEYWPFSPYPMFSILYPQRRFTTLRLYGVTQGQPPSEFPLDRNEYLQPFDNSRLPAALAIALDENQLTPVMEDCLKRYEALRVSGIHHGPPIQGLRLYRVSWNLSLQADNVENPDHKELLGEFSGAVSRAP